MKTVYFLLILLIVICLGIFVTIIKLTNSVNKPMVTINEKKFSAEIAKTDLQKEKGLSIYNKINDDFAMVFPFVNPGFYTFWMKDMKFSIDIIYVKNNKIVDIFQNIPYPKSATSPLPFYKPSNLSDTVLEINSGLSKKYNFKKGNSVKIIY